MGRFLPFPLSVESECYSLKPHKCKALDEVIPSYTYTATVIMGNTRIGGKWDSGRDGNPPD